MENAEVIDILYTNHLFEIQVQSNVFPKFFRYEMNCVECLGLSFCQGSREGCLIMDGQGSQ